MDNVFAMLIKVCTIISLLIEGSKDPDFHSSPLKITDLDALRIFFMSC